MTGPDGLDLRARLMMIYERLMGRFGPQHWWPAETPFEVAVGAVLTQGVAWRNVEAAIAGLKRAGLLEPQRMARAPLAEVAALIRPAGYYNVKAKKLRALTGHLVERYGGDMARLGDRPAAALRAELLELYGIGPETADAIVLYAANLPAFVVDAYTVRIVRRLGLVPAAPPAAAPARREPVYDQVQRLFTDALPADPALFNEYHALLVRLGKDACRARRPPCPTCPLVDMCPGLEI